MNTTAYTNMILEIYDCVICVIILLCMILSDYYKQKLARCYVLLVLCQTFLLVVDALIFAFDGNLLQYTRFTIQLTFFLSYMLGSILLILFTYYFKIFLSMKATISKTISYVFYASFTACTINILVDILTQFNGIYYYFATDNTFRLGEYYWLSQVLVFLCYILNISIMIVHRKSFVLREFLIFLSYIIFPLVAQVTHNFLSGIAVIDHATTFAILVFYAGIQSEQAKQLKQKELELANTQIDVMLTQIQPHFIYNKLATIEAFCNKDDNREAAKMVHDFSNYLRKNMDSLTQKELINFNREIEHIKIYLDIEKQRLRERLTIVYDLEITDFQLPILTVQPLVENAVRYGVSKKRYGGTVTIKTTLVHEDIRIIVSDDGVGFDTENPKQQDTRSHIGIENVQERLRVQCDGTLIIKSEIGKGTVCTITIPQGNFKF